MKKFFLISVFGLSVLPTAADEYTDPATNVIYTYQPGNPSAIVKCGNRVDSDDGTTEYVSGNPDAKGNIRILDKFTVNGEEYVVKGIGNFAFVLNEDITSVLLPSTIETVGMESFYGCILLETITFSDGLKKLGHRSFTACSSLSSLILPEGLEEIGFEAFALCKELKSVHIPSSMTTINPLTFYGCEDLEAISIEEGNMYFYSYEECNAVIEKATNRLIIGCKTTVIPPTVRAIGYQAFFRCKELDRMVFPESVNTIGSSAFDGCESLSEVILPQSLKAIEDYAFKSCNLTAVTIPSDVKEIGTWAFNTPVLKSIVSLIEEPFACSDICDFSKSTTTLYVPTGTKKKYQSTEGWNKFKVIEEMEMCATPTIAYDKGRLVFNCETEGAECVYEIKCTDAGSGRSNEVSLSRTYEIRVHATLDGWQDSEVATATIGWRNGRPVMEGFSSITMGEGDGMGDVNGDGKVDVADIATIISVMAGQPSE